MRGALCSDHWDSPYVIFGPPGTGKTSTVAELVKQALAGSGSMPSDCRVLVLAPSNAAVDGITKRLLDGGGVQPGQLLRVNAYGRPTEGMSPEILACSLYDGHDDGFRFPEVGDMQRARVVTMTCMTMAKVACVPDMCAANLQFDLVVVDEAGHSMEPEASAFLGLLRRPNGRLVFAGDHKQLGPIVQSPLAKERLGTSLLERLCASPPYAPDANGEFDGRFVTMLSRNYRSHPAIIELPSRMFYHDKLKPFADEHYTRSLLDWEGLATPGTEADFPVLFHGVQGEDMQEANSPSWFNPIEGAAVVQHVESLLRHRGSGVTQRDIGVIAPYHRQKTKLRNEFARRGWNEVTVGTAEEFQGAERRVIIITLTRSSPDRLNFDARFQLGFVDSPQRFNVAVTRAKCLLIIVGNPHLMVDSSSGLWGRMLRFCVERGGYFGCDLPEGLEEHTEFGATEMPSPQNAARPTFKEVEFEKEVEELADAFSPGPRGRREAV